MTNTRMELNDHSEISVLLWSGALPCVTVIETRGSMRRAIEFWPGFEPAAHLPSRSGAAKTLEEDEIVDWILNHLGWAKEEFIDRMNSISEVTALSVQDFRTRLTPWFEIK